MTTSSAAINAAIVPINEEGMVPAGFSFPLAQSAGPAGKFQYITVSPSTGYASPADDATPHQIAGGFVYPDEVTTSDSSNAGNAVVRTSERYATHATPSTVSNDGFTLADVGTPWWIADTETPGKLSHTGTTAGGTLKDRSMGGLVLGLVAKGRTAIRHWGGAIAQAIARGVHLADNANGGLVAYPADATASTDIGSTSAATSSLVIPRSKTHGLITSIEIIPSASLAATSGNDRTITVWKVDTLGVETPVSVATFTTTTALTAQTATAFTLSGTALNLHLLETDILTYSTVHASSGATIPQSAIRVNMKVI